MHFSEHVAEMVHRRWGALLTEVGAEAVERYRDGIPLPRRHLTNAGEQGIQSLHFPEEIGGEGVDARTWGTVLEEIAYQCPDAAFPILLSMGTGVADILVSSGRPELIDRYVVPIITGKRTATLAFSEDADPFALHTVARRTPGGFQLSGRKDYMTGGLTSDVLLCYARMEDTDRIAAFVVEHDDPGVQVSPAGGIGFSSSAMGSMTLADVRLPKDRLVDIDGTQHAQRYLNSRRLYLACLVTGMMRAVADRALSRLRCARRQGQTLIEFPNVQATVGRMHIAVQATRALLHQTLADVDRGMTDPVFDVQISATKHFATEKALFVVNQAMRVLGGHGYYGDYFYGAFLRDCTGLLCAAGTQDLLEINIGALVAARPLPGTMRKEERS
ncbi:acyl-CoA dehydrogenase family protein [Streptomyces sp. NPDC053427]|uniref:acyl-CoA dehydrogenase family protein n=1 Tax=Streptomyces sp. NPDC053427 TaxID=3365701 RepID=UPI0037D45EE4